MNGWMKEEQWKCRIRFFWTKAIIMALPVLLMLPLLLLVSLHIKYRKHVRRKHTLQFHQFCLQLQPFDVIALFIALHYYYIGIKLTVTKLSTEYLLSAMLHVNAIRIQKQRQKDEWYDTFVWSACALLQICVSNLSHCFIQLWNVTVFNV